MSKKLDLGWTQSYMGLLQHMEDALREAGTGTEGTPKGTEGTPNACPPQALFAHQYYNQIQELPQEKIYDFCFIGSLQSNASRRKWVLDFVRKHFTEKSYFVNTDSPKILLGSFDQSHVHAGQNPKKHKNNQSREAQQRIVSENKAQFGVMCQSQQVLCPAGDAPWSFRFQETILCNAMPIVESWHHTQRTREEAGLDYKQVLQQNFKKAENVHMEILENRRIFQKYHMLPSTIQAHHGT